MNDGYGPRLSASFVFYDRDSSSWRMSQACLPWASPVFSGTWPRSGTMRNGQCFEHPMQERPTDESESSSSRWITPSAADGKKYGETVEGWEGRAAAAAAAARGIHKQETPAVQLKQFWPTPTRADGEGGAGHQGRAGGLNLRTAVAARHSDRPSERLSNAPALASQVNMEWPTPIASLARGPGQGKDRQGGDNLRLATREWPTPTVTGNHNRKGASATSQDGLSTAVKEWPTPTVARLYGTNRSDSPNAAVRPGLGLAAQQEETTGEDPLEASPLNPAWVCCVMGFDPDWLNTDGPLAGAKRSTRGNRRAPSKSAPTDPPSSEPSATPSSRSKRPSRGARSSPG